MSATISWPRWTAVAFRRARGRSPGVDKICVVGELWREPVVDIAMSAVSDPARLDQLVGMLAMASVDAVQVVGFELEGEEAVTRIRAAALILTSYERLRSVARQGSDVEEFRRDLQEVRERLDANSNQSDA